MYTFVVHFAGVAQLVEHQPSKLRVASSNLVSRSETKEDKITIVVFSSYLGFIWLFI